MASRVGPGRADPPGAAPAGGGSGRTFRRSLGTRVLSVVCVPVFAGGAVSFAVSSGVTAGFYVLGAAAALSLLNLVTAWADRYTLDDDGIEYRNRLLSPLGLGHRRVAWEDVVRVREHRRLGAGGPEDRPSALLLSVRSGRRMVLDALEDFDEVLRAVRHHCAAPDGPSPPPADRGGA
jgi:hypothetical protein